jgi:iron complex outermembrane receptor protein
MNQCAWSFWRAGEGLGVLRTRKIRKWGALTWSLAAVPLFVSQLAVAATEEAGATQLEEITVTAQKKEQRLEDVGISITALSAADVQNNDIRVAEDIVKLVPSLQYNAFTPGAVVFDIRGVSQNDFGDQQEPPIAVYYDDSYASNLNLSSFPIFDLQRVEVLRGPQGTLFGRNATGGAIQYITNKPTEEFESYLTLTTGRFNEFDAQGAVSGSIAPTLQDRFSFERQGNEGYSYDIYDGSRRGGAHNYALREELAAQLGGGVDALLTLRYSRNLNENNAGDYSWVSAYNYPSTHGLGTYGSPSLPNPFGTCPGCDLGGYSNYALDPRFAGDPWKVAMNRPADFDRTLRGASFKIDGKVGGIDLVSVSDFLNMQKADLEDGDGSPNTSFNTDLRDQLTQYTEEVRASATSHFNDWVAGAFFMHINGHYSYVADFASFGNYVLDGAWQQSTLSKAIFAQDEIKIADQWSVIAGARYWHDERQIGLLLSDNFGGAFDYSPETYPGSANRIFDNYSAKLELDRKFEDGSLAYVSWNRGTKSGGYTVPFSLPTGTSAAAIDAFTKDLTYNPEILNSYEIGLKTKLFGGTTSINADFFYYDYRDYQAYILYGPTTTIKNLDAKEHGFELEAVTHPVEPLTLSTGISSLRSRVQDVILPDGTPTDRELPQAPTWSGHASIRYQVPLPTGDKMSAQWLTTYTGRTCFTALCAPIDVESGHAVSEARISYESSRNWDVALSVDNVTNRVYRVFDSDTSFIGVAEAIYAPPMWWHLTATVRFGGHQH